MFTALDRRDFHVFRVFHQSEFAPHAILDRARDCGIFFQELLHVLAPLPEPFTVEGEPRAALLDDLPVDSVREFETFFYGWIERKKPEIFAEVRDKKEISDALRETLIKAINDAKTEFVAAKGIKAA